MPTLEEAINTKLVTTMGGNLKPHQQPTRLLLAVPEVTEWMKLVLPTAKSDGYVAGATNPLQQLLSLFNQFVAGKDLDDPLPHPMRPHHQGIYRVRTADVRLDGWFPRKGCFIIGAAELTSICKRTAGRDDEMRDTARAWREKLMIEDGNFLTGDYNDHL